MESLAPGMIEAVYWPAPTLALRSSAPWVTSTGSFSLDIMSLASSGRPPRPARTLGRKIIRDHATGIGPADQHRAFEPGGVDHRLHLVTPGLGIPVMRGIQRLVGIAVPAQIVGHDAKLLGEVAVDLAHPRQMTL